MFNPFKRWFRKSEPPKPPFIDPVLGQFEFDRELGWKKDITLAGQEIELVLASDGESPSGEMLQMAKAWIEQWPFRRQEIVEYITGQLQHWENEPDIPIPEELEVASFNFLWRETPRTCMIYFTYPGDDLRAWHVTVEGFCPKGFAYDD